MLTNLPLTPLGTGSLPAAAGALVAGDGVQKRLDAVQPGGDELGDVQHLGGPFGLRSLARAEHDLAERAARGDDLGAGLHCLREALLRDPPVTGLLLLPELRATGAAAEGVVAALLHLEQVRAAPAEDRARRVVLAVVPAQVAGVVERDAAGLGQRRQATLGWQPLDQLRVMHHPLVTAQLRAVVDERGEIGAA